MVSVSNGSGNGFLSGIFNFFNQFFAPPDPPTLVSATGNAFDLPNSQIVEISPTLPSLETPSNPAYNSFIPQSNFNLFQNSILGSLPFNEPNIPNIPNFTP